VLPQTIHFYNYTAGKFNKYLEKNGITGPKGITLLNISAYLSTTVKCVLSDSYMHGHTGAIRTPICFWHTEKYIPERISCQMRTIAKKHLPVQSAEEVRQIISVCQLPEIKPLCFLWSISGRSMRFKLGRCGYSQWFWYGSQEEKVEKQEVLSSV
jgi:site-specific recombinase XerD